MKNDKATEMVFDLLDTCVRPLRKTRLVLGKTTGQAIEETWIHNVGVTIEGAAQVAYAALLKLLDAESDMERNSIWVALNMLMFTEPQDEIVVMIRDCVQQGWVDEAAIYKLKQAARRYAVEHLMDLMHHFRCYQEERYAEQIDRLIQGII